MLRLLKELKFFAEDLLSLALVDEVLSMARPIQIKERLKDFYDYRVANFLA